MGVLLQLLLRRLGLWRLKDSCMGVLLQLLLRRLGLRRMKDDLRGLLLLLLLLLTCARLGMCTCTAPCLCGHCE